MRTVAVTRAPGRAAELDRGGADAAGAAVDEQPLAGLQAGLVKTASWAVVNTSGTPPASGQLRFSGTGISIRSCTTAELRLAAAADDPHHAVARTGSASAPGPQLDDLAGQLEPGDVLRRARRRGIAAAPLVHVGAVEPGRLDATSTSPGAGVGVRMLLDAQLLSLRIVTARMQPEPYPRANAVRARATHSMCGVWGNMSTGRTRVSV